MINQTFKIEKPDIFAPHPKLQQHVQTGNARRPATGRDDLDLVKAFARHMQRVGGRSADHNRRAVLVIMEHWDFHPLTAQSLHDKAVGGFDVLQVDRAEGGFQRTDDIGQFVGISLVHFDIETVYIGEFLEQNRLAFHHRL